MECKEYIDYYGTIRWIRDGLLHRERDKPALIFMNGERQWFQHGKWHRENNPAIIRGDEKNIHLYFLSSVQYKQKAYWTRLLLLEY